MQRTQNSIYLLESKSKVVYFLSMQNTDIKEKIVLLIREKAKICINRIWGETELSVLVF